MAYKRDSDSPVLFLGISIAYSQASQIIWRSEFANRDPFHWDIAILIHPVANLLGVSIETAIKGILSCQGAPVPRSHDLVDLLGKVSDQEIRNRLNECLDGIQVPESLYELNEDTPRDEIDALYRRHHIHFDALNRVSNRPFATRYPVLGGHSLPDTIALGRIAEVLQDRLRADVSSWPAGM